MEPLSSTSERPRRLALAMAGAATLGVLAACSDGADVRVDGRPPDASASDVRSSDPPTGAVQGDPALFDYDDAGRVRLTTTRTRTVGPVTQREVSYPSPQGGTVTATLTTPDTDARNAGMLLLHGMPLDRNDMREPALVYACAGATTLAIDAPYARGRSPRTEDAITLTHQDRTEQIQFIVDLRRGVDLLQQRGAARVSLLGISYGASMGALLAGVEDRLDSAALIVGDGGLVAHMTHPDGSPVAGLGMLPDRRKNAWLDDMRPIEPLLYVGDSEANLLMMNGRHDTQVEPADAEQLHAAAGENSEVRWYDTGHDLPADAFRYQFEWVGEQLDLDPGRLAECVDEYGHLDQFS